MQDLADTRIFRSTHIGLELRSRTDLPNFMTSQKPSDVRRKEVVSWLIALIVFGSASLFACRLPLATRQVFWLSVPYLLDSSSGYGPLLRHIPLWLHERGRHRSFAIHLPFSNLSGPPAPLASNGPRRLHPAHRSRRLCRMILSVQSDMGVEQYPKASGLGGLLCFVTFAKLLSSQSLGATSPSRPTFAKYLGN